MVSIVIILYRANADDTDILDFADIIGPGGKGLVAGEESDDNGFDLSDLDEEEDDDSEDGSEDPYGLEDGTSGDEQSGDESDAGEEQGEDTEGEDTEAEGSEKYSDPDGIDLLDDEESWNGIQDEDPMPAGPVPSAAEPTKYIPPHLRAAALADKAAGDAQKIEERRKLERKTQGLLNK